MDTGAAAPRWPGKDDPPSWHPSEIRPGLFMSGTDDREQIDVPAPLVETFGDDRPFDAVVTLYAWAQPVTWEVEELRYGFGDAEIDTVDVSRVVRTSMWAWERWRNGDRVLIRCQAGLNRAGLVVALVLMLDGHTADEAIALVRQRRSQHALCNQSFVSWLGIEGARRLAEHKPAKANPQAGDVENPGSAPSVG
jgi:hypothetical protein